MTSPTDEIRRLLFEYADCVDRADYDGIGELFAHARLDADRMEPIEGREAVGAFYRGANRRYPDGTARTRHLTTNVVIDLDPSGDSATVRSSYLVFQQTDALPLQPIICGRYRDRFERVEGRWRFRERHIGVDLIGDLSHHLTFALDG